MLQKVITKNKRKRWEKDFADLLHLLENFLTEEVCTLTPTLSTTLTLKDNVFGPTK